MVTKTISWWAYLNSTWTEFTSYVYYNDRFSVSSFRGMLSNQVGDNLASTGYVNLTVNNEDGRFDPDSTTALSGWGKGTVIEMRVLYTERTFKRFRGHIDTIKPNDVSVGNHSCSVTILDFMDYIYNMPFTAPLIQLNKTGDVAVNALIADMPIQPQATSIQTGSYTYPAIFDTTSTTAKMSTELQKIVDSEGSYFYIRCDPTYGETLVFENALARNGLVAAKSLPETLTDSKYLIDHAGRYLIDHLGRKLKANEACNCVLGDVINSQDRNNGTVINKATIRAFPKKTDASNKVLYRLDSPMLLGSGETKTFNGRYTNPTETTSAQVNAVQSSMSVTTKTMNTLIDGTGTDLSASLTATAVFYSSYPEWTVTNASGYAGYITVLTASGYGVYQDNPIEFSVEDTTSQNSYGVNEYRIDQQYQRDIAPGAQLVAGILDENKQPSTKWDRVTFQADRSDELMIAFLNVDIGDMIQITNAALNTDSYFFVQGIDFTIEVGELITFSWILKKKDNLSLGLSPVAVEFHGTNADYVDFGYLPQASSLNDKTLSAWVYLTAYVFGWAIGNMGIFGGCGLGFSTVNPATSLSENNFFTYVRATGWATTSGQWKATTTFNTNAWVHILTTIHPKDNTSNPILYINGVSSSVTETEAPTGAYIGTEWNTRLGMEALYLSPTGKVKDARAYNRILTPIEAAAITNEGAYGTGVLDGLVFQAPCVRTKQLSYFTDKTLASSDKIIDNIYGAIGTPNGSPITRLP
jgi:hypothetical protein